MRCPRCEGSGAVVNLEILIVKHTSSRDEPRGGPAGVLEPPVDHFRKAEGQRISSDEVPLIRMEMFERVIMKPDVRRQLEDVANLSIQESTNGRVVKQSFAMKRFPMFQADTVFQKLEFFFIFSGERRHEEDQWLVYPYPMPLSGVKLSFLYALYSLGFIGIGIWLMILRLTSA